MQGEGEGTKARSRFSTIAWNERGESLPPNGEISKHHARKGKREGGDSEREGPKASGAPRAPPKERGGEASAAPVTEKKEKPFATLEPETA